ncbi:MAG TPA: hypothetical protein VKA26_06265 [Ignavibacteriaceae bacterium]|nr:hypothetical protein [Ignavibacteriaceae bacterium]
MKYFPLFAFSILIFSSSYSQVKLRGGMGVDYISMPALYDYINQNFAPPGKQLGSFKTAVGFSLEGDYALSDHYEIGIDLTYRLFSYNTTTNIGLYDISYHNIMPTIVNYYVFGGESYQFKFGGGVGARFLNAEESLPSDPNPRKYSKTGFGFLARAAGNTKLSEDFYINICFDIRYDLNGEPENNGTPIYNYASQTNVSFNSFSIGLGIGLTYFL